MSNTSFSGPLTVGGTTHYNTTAYAFEVVNQTTNQNYVTVKHGSALDLVEYLVPRPGSLVGISVITNDARSGGSAQFLATINGTTVPALAVTLDAGDTTNVSSAVVKDTATLTVTAGQRIGVKVKTSPDWAPTTADIGIELHYES